MLIDHDTSLIINDANPVNHATLLILIDEDLGDLASRIDFNYLLLIFRVSRTTLYMNTGTFCPQERTAQATSEAQADLE